MSEEPVLEVHAPIDVRSAIEWAWMNMEPCILRDQNNIPVGLDFSKAKTDPPAGGRQMLDLAYTNKVAFQKDFVLKVIGHELADEDLAVVNDEKQSIEKMRELLVRFEESGKK